MKSHSQAVCAVCACVYAGVVWAGVALRIEDVTAIPETPRLPIGVFATGPGQVSAVDVQIAFQKADLAFVEAALAAGVLKDGVAQVRFAPLRARLLRLNFSGASNSGRVIALRRVELRQD